MGRLDVASGSRLVDIAPLHAYYDCTDIFRTLLGVNLMSASAKESPERMDIRLPSAVKAKLKKASALTGMSSLSEYVVRAAEADADRVLTENASMVLKPDVFDQFMAACEKATPPNAALRKAAKLTRERGIG